MAEALLGIRRLNRQSSTARSSSAESMICNRSGAKVSNLGPSSSEWVDKAEIAEIRVSLSRTLIELLSPGVTEYRDLLRLTLGKALAPNKRDGRRRELAMPRRRATLKGQSDRNPRGGTRIEDHGVGSRPEILFKTPWCRIRVRRKLGARAQLVRSSAAKPCFRRLHAGVCGHPRSR